MIAAAQRVGGYCVLHTRLLCRDGQAVFWNWAFFSLLLVIFLAFLSRGDAAVRVALTAAVVTVGIMANALFSLGVGLAGARERGVYREYDAALARVWELLLAAGIARAAMIFSAAVSQLVLARVLFGVRWTGDPIGVIAILLLGTAAFGAMGFAIAASSASSRTANRTANMLLLPMMALGGTALPAAMLPANVQVLRSVLPVAAIQDGLTGALVYGDTLMEHGIRLGWLAGWTGVALAVGVLTWKRPRSA